MKIEVKRQRNRIKIYFNDLLHFSISSNNLIISSWIFSTENLYYIEFISEYGSTVLDYDVKEHWEEILKKLDKVLE